MLSDTFRPNTIGTPLGEKAVQVINDKKVSSLSKPNASIEEGKAKGNVKGCRITNKK